MRHGLWMTAAVLWAAGCAGPAEPDVELLLASDRPWAGAREEAGPDGRPLYVSPAPLAVRADFFDVQPYPGGPDPRIEIILEPGAAEAAAERARRRAGGMVAVRLAGAIVLAAPIGPELAADELVVLRSSLPPEELLALAADLGHG